MDDVAPIANTATCPRKTACARRVSARVRTGANPTSVTKSPLTAKLAAQTIAVRVEWMWMVDDAQSRYRRAARVGRRGGVRVRSKIEPVIGSVAPTLV